MKTWILSTVIIGAICFYGASIVSKAVKSHSSNQEYNVLIQHNNQLTTALDYLKSELGE